MTFSTSPSSLEDSNLRDWLGEEAAKLGFDQLRITDTYLGSASERLKQWLADGRLLLAYCSGLVHYFQPGRRGQSCTWCIVCDRLSRWAF
jgi:hypothetical protein